MKKQIRKWIGMLLTLALLLSLAGTAHMEKAAETEEKTFEKAGITVDYPLALDGAKGTVELNEKAVTMPECYLLEAYYTAMPAEDIEALTEKFNDGTITQEEYDNYISRVSELGFFIAINGQLSDIESLAELVDKAEELEQQDGLNCYYVDLTTEDFPEGWEETYREEAKELSAKIPEMLKAARFVKPANPWLGKKIEFTAEDADGKTWTSAELFARNRYTMMNIWGTWCGPCVGELGELARIHQQLEKKDCGLLGLEYEYNYDADTLQEGKDLLAENGATYPNVLVNDDMTFMNEITGVPTSFFVDSEGTVVGGPVAGANIEAYEKILADLNLLGEE